ncbi:hypothetical lipopolysaccharide O-side chain biosynthesis protein [Thermococcus onnurineus NA1]|uniref:Hypothetical lipopolysaccharide O-side chain biosynthesis protein n=1 Tax=Thermococcus onnurineus (strain NA1) TaxID=523850 RepID=B6YVL8_THEON|nr:flippase [Thermococcus onnurineus]ACJ17342.1 hypothetical lipopolysaccharide O-side chain biosynthesis protein [Thermococcus onnurineus NA1]
MNTVQRIAKNMAVLFLARIVSMLFGFFYVVYTARYLGPANYGILSFALALNGIFGVITNFGLDPLTVREVARDKSLAGKYLANGIVLKLLFGTLTFLIVFVVVNLLGYPEITRKVVYIITLSTIIAGLNNLFNDIYQAFERMEFMSIGQILQSVLSLVFAITAIKLGLNVVYFAMIYLSVNLIILGYHVVVTTWKFLKPKIEVDFSFWKSVVREAWPFALTAISISLYLWIDSVMLSYMEGDRAVGLYNAAYRLALIFLFVPTIFNTAIFPLMSRLYIGSKENLTKILEKHFKYMVIVGILIGTWIICLPGEFIVIVFGKDYLGATNVLRIFGLTLIFIFFRTAFERVLEASNRQAIVTRTFVEGAVLNIFLNLILIPIYSLNGAAIATLITDIFVFVVLYLRGMKLGYRLRRSSFINVIKIVVSGIILSGFLTVFAHINLAILLSMSSLLYIGLLRLLKVIDTEDLMIAKGGL